MLGRFSDIIRIQSYLLYGLAAAMVIPLVLAFAYGERASLFAFAEVIFGCVILGSLARFCTRPISRSLMLRQKFFVISFSWLVASLIGSFPFILSGVLPSFADAFFESCSGFTTTGACVISNIEAFPRSMIFWRSLTQWLGGLAIMLFVSSLLPVLGKNGQTFPLYKIYIGLSLSEAVLLILGGMSIFDSLIHTFSTVSTGGFSSYNDSIAHFDSLYIKLIIVIFMLLAGSNLTLFFLWKRRGFSAVSGDEELRFYLTCTGVFSLLIFIVSGIFDSFEDLVNTLANSIFTVVSTITTTGFCVADYGLWPTFAQMVILCLFFFGGCQFSVSGGVKCVRVLVGLKLIHRSVSLRIHPARIAPVMINDSEIPTDAVIRITGFIMTYIVVFFSGMLLISIDNFDFVTSFTAAASCLGNIGAGFNSVGPAGNYAAFSIFSKAVCSFLMIAGRLELFTVFILFSKYYRHPNKAN